MYNNTKEKLIVLHKKGIQNTETLEILQLLANKKALGMEHTINKIEATALDVLKQTN